MTQRDQLHAAFVTSDELASDVAEFCEWLIDEELSSPSDQDQVVVPPGKGN